MIELHREYDPAPFLLHRSPALLIDSVWIDSETRVCGRYRVRPVPVLGLTEYEVPGWLLIELIAQVIATGAGMRGYRTGERPPIGLLTGVRNFELRKFPITIGQCIEIVADEALRDSRGFGIYDCEARIGLEQLATATLAVFLTESTESYLEGAVE